MAKDITSATEYKIGNTTYIVNTYWSEQTINKMLDRIEYAGHTANFKTKKKSYKNKKKIDNPKSEWQIFENTHPFREWYTVLIVARKCICAEQKALILTKNT